MFKRILITVTGGMLALSLSACGDQSETTEDASGKTNEEAVLSKNGESQKNEDLDKAKKTVEPIQLIPSSQNEHLKDYVTSVDSPSIEFQEQEIKIIGIDFGKKGIPSILGIKEVSGEYIGSFSVLKGLNSDNKKDAELILFFELQSQQDIEPRSGIPATLPEITVTDDRDDSAKEVAKVPNSTTEVYYQKGESVIAAVGFAVYSDAESFIINIEGNKFLVNELTYRTKDEF